MFTHLCFFSFLFQVGRGPLHFCTRRGTSIMAHGLSADSLERTGILLIDAFDLFGCLLHLSSLINTIPQCNSVILCPIIQIKFQVTLLLCLKSKEHTCSQIVILGMCMMMPTVLDVAYMRQRLSSLFVKLNKSLFFSCVSDSKGTAMSPFSRLFVTL